MEWYWILLIVLGSIALLLLVVTIFYYPFFKRVCDIICGLSVFVFLWPLYLVLVILVRTKLGKPVLFRQVRPGKDGKLFILYKFRSMTDERDENGNLLPDSIRLTKFGKWLRNSSLDEMPEAINILKGNMSVVGPRPFLVKDFVFFDEETMKRQNVKPGLTGLAQVNGRNGISWEDKFKYDLEYCEKISFWKDAALVFRTIFKAFAKKENINREGFATDEDYGDYLLRTNKISHDYYNLKIASAKDIIRSDKEITMVKPFLKKIINKVNNKKTLKVLFMSIVIAGYSLTYIAGCFHPNTIIEETSNYLAFVAKNYTKGGNYVPLVIEPKDAKKSQMIDPVLELYNLYDVFKGNSPSYTSIINSNHDHNIHFKDFNTDKNLSCVYVKSGFNTVEYKDHYKHEFFPLEVMFKREKIGPTLPRMMYISVSHANKILDLNSMEHSTENYKWLCTQSATVVIDGVDYEYSIEDIYYEYNVYYSSIKDCAGDFLFVSQGYPDTIKNQSMYFLSEYSFRNKYFIEYANNLYSTADYDYSIGINNFKEGVSLDVSKLIFAPTSKYPAIPALMVIFSILLISVSLFVLIASNISESILYSSLFLAMSLFPYIIFRVVSLLSESVLFFSSFSNFINMIMILISFSTLVITFLIKMSIRKKRILNDDKSQNLY